MTVYGSPVLSDSPQFLDAVSVDQNSRCPSPTSTGALSEEVKNLFVKIIKEIPNKTGMKYWRNIPIDIQEPIDVKINFFSEC